MDFANEIYDCVALMCEGKIVDIGKPEHVLSQLTEEEKVKATSVKTQVFEEQNKTIQVRYTFYSESLFTFLFR